MRSPVSPLLLLLLVGFAAAAMLPPSLKRCKQNDPDFNGCMKKAFTDALPVLQKGVPTLRLPTLDPLHITQIRIQDAPGQPVSLNLEFNEVDITGIATGVCDFVEMKPGSFSMKAKFHADAPFTLSGPYKADGKVLVLPIKGEGLSKLVAPRLEATCEMSGQPIERNGQVYWDVTDFKVDIIFDKFSIELTGLYNNDKALADNTLKFLNENSAEIGKELEPALEEALGEFLKQLAKRVFDNVAYKDVFPPS